ncbi:hypothetical protein BaRGS_00015927 [Batillaria attramentaria]|uniref:Uncharacterized protein n=1 Tax=Batillaria attramentaria TaxID=370345 RepID=A0ABD0L133_9CAEN
METMLLLSQQGSPAAGGYIETTFGAGSFSPITHTVPMGEGDSVFSSPRTSSFSHGEASDSGVSGMNSLQVPSPTHKRSGSNLSSSSLFAEEEEEIQVFVEPPSKKLFCRLCDKVFNNPVIVACGHTYCRRCVQSRSDGLCPVDDQKLSVVVANIAVSEQIGEMLVHCRYGCKLDTTSNSYVVDPTRCQATVKLSSRREHEETCDFMPMECPNNTGCASILRKDFEDHLRVCNNVRLSLSKVQL